MGFSVLSRFDDVLANYFVDKLCLWFNTARMNRDFISPDIDCHQIIDIIRTHVVIASDPTKASEVFLQLPYFTEFLKDKTKRQVIEFTQHMKRYLYMFMPNAGFEISSTKRYTGKMEACLLATRDWKAGEQVKSCLGSIAALTKEEDAMLKSENRDFSVMVSTRKKCSCLFLGPARFMNHDCEANCEFFISGQNALTFTVIKNIKQGEEMTVHYGTHYFGIDNCECLCATCERSQRGVFSVKTTDNDSHPLEIKTDDTMTVRRSHRKRKQVNYSEETTVIVKKQRDNSATPELTDTQNTIHSPLSSMESSESSKHDLYYTTSDNIRSNEMELSFICDTYAYESTRQSFEIHTSQEYIFTTDYKHIHSQGFQLSLYDNTACTYQSCCLLRDISNVEMSCDPTLCNKCYRHKMIFGYCWPIRRIEDPPAIKKPAAVKKSGRRKASRSKYTKKLVYSSVVAVEYQECVFSPLDYSDAYCITTYVPSVQSEEENQLSWKFQ